MIIFYGLRLYKNELRLYKNEHRLFVMEIYFMHFDFVLKIWNNIVTLVLLSTLGKHIAVATLVLRMDFGALTAVDREVCEQWCHFPTPLVRIQNRFV